MVGGVLDLHVDLDPFRHKKPQRFILLCAYLINLQYLLSQLLLKKHRILLHRLLQIYLQQRHHKQHAAYNNGQSLHKTARSHIEHTGGKPRKNDNEKHGDEYEHHDEVGVVDDEHGYEGVVVLGVLEVEENCVEFAHVK